MNQNTLSNQSTVQLFKKYVFSPFQSRTIPSDEDELQHIAQQIYNWARNNGAQYISFFAHPMRQQTLQKPATFLSLKFIKQNLLSSIGSQKLKFSHIWKGQLDGSSIPNGGLRQSHQSRSCLLWDHFSELFIRKRNKVLYIPSFIVTPQGHALDDRLHFRKAQKLFEKEMGRLLKRFKIDYQEVFLSVSLEQQFFIVPKEFAQKRLDLKYTNRLMIGKKPLYHPAKYHYLKKIPEQVQKALRQAQKQLLELGVPIKVRHCEGGVNQFQIQSQVQNVAASIDHNILKMQIIKESCQRNGLWALFHEKPFANINGSGKHINWSLSYLDNEQKLNNLYDLKHENKQLLTLVILLTIKAAQDNHKLFIASTMTAGNQVRLGQKQAPLPVMSVYLGEEASHLVEGLPMPQLSNLKDKIDVLLKDQYPQIGDRNRSSTLAYSQNRFQFRLAGSAQNCTFPITVIMTSLLNQIKILLDKMDNGQTVSQIITEYREYTRLVRYQGNCYSEEWKQQAEKRGLYNPHKTIVERLKNIKSQRQILVDNQIYSNRQIEAKYKVMRIDYMDTVRIQKQCLLKMINTDIIPRSFSFISTFPRQLHLKNIQNRMRKFDKLLEELLGKTQELQNTEIDEKQLSSSFKVRQEIFKISDLVDKVLEMLPQSQSFPQLNRYLNKWQVA